MKLYDTSALFGQNMSSEKQELFLDYYRQVFGKYNIKTIHDCSIGAGGTTLPLAKLGYKVSGSDLSTNLLNKAKENFMLHGYDIDLCVADFREIDTVLPDNYDCIISTGNSLPHICNKDVEVFIKAASQKINDNGYLYIDIRNWDSIVKERPIFNAIDPKVMTNEEHTSLYLIWNWHDNGSVDFVFVTSTDINGKHKKASIIKAPTYYPLKLNDYKTMLEKNGFIVRKCYDIDHLWLGSKNEDKKVGSFDKDFEYIQWYGILAQKL